MEAATSSNQKMPISDFGQMAGTSSAKSVLGKSERLRGFISSVDIREQRHFFFFQPVVLAEELECPSYPYLPPLLEKNAYTLVLDLDETLIHYQEATKQVLLRPNVQAFLTGLAPHFEIVVFTAAIQKVRLAHQYADCILDRLDPGKCVKHRLYRQHTKQLNGIFIKDLSLLGRDIRKVLIIDNNAENFQLQPENGICIKSWFGEQEDLALTIIFPVLKSTPGSPELKLFEVEDVRSALRGIKEKIREEQT